MTMTGKRKYMPHLLLVQVTNDKVNLKVYKNFCQNPKHLNDPLYCRCVEQAATLSHLQFMFSRYSFLSKVLSANSPDEWEGTKLINVLLPSWSILVYKKYATIFAQRCFSSKLWSKVQSTVQSWFSDTFWYIKTVTISIDFMY